MGSRKKTHFEGHSPEDDVWAPEEGQRQVRASDAGSLHEYVERPSVDETVFPDIRLSGVTTSESPSAPPPPPKLSLSRPRPSSQQNEGPTLRKTSKLQPQDFDLQRKKKSSTPTLPSYYSAPRKSTFYRKYSGGGDNASILMDWNNTSGWTRMLGFNLEYWWRRSTNAHRINAGFVALCLTISILYLIFGVHLIWTSFTRPLKNPYVCTKPECQKASQWISEFMNTSSDPCNNFYDFICGNYHHETEKEGNLFDSVIHDPAYPIEFGENSMLAKILKNYSNDASLDQPIEYYRNCLNDEIRKDFGLEALLETIEYVFGTRDFTTFESSNTLSMEEIGSRMFETCGHAAYINMAFYTYPFIQIIRPSEFTYSLLFWNGTHDDVEDLVQQNRKFVTKILEGLLPLLKVPPNSKLKQDMLEGVNMLTTMVGLISLHTGPIRMPKVTDNFLDSDYQKYIEKMKTGLLDKGLCPPMGVVNLDMRKVLQLFLHEDQYRIDYLDLMSLKFFDGIQMCFDHDPKIYVPLDPKPKNPWVYKFTYPKTAFALWLVELFWDFHFSAEPDLLPKWGLTQAELHDNDDRIISFRFTDSDTELRCLVSTWRNLGYMPSIRFLTANHPNPLEFITDVEIEIVKLFKKISDIFDRIPPTEIALVQQYMGEIMFSRGLYVDFMMPLVSGYLDNSSAADILPFTKNHLRNSLISVKYTVEKARQNWLGSTNTRATMKWWGDGEPNEIRYELLDLREPMIVHAPFVEQFHSANMKTFDLFLGQPDRNYILFPVSMMYEPHITETLALKYGGSIVKQLRAFFKIVQEPFLHERYTSLPLISDLVYFPNVEAEDRNCSVLLNKSPQSEDNHDHYKYIWTNIDMYAFSWNYDTNYFSLLALKEAFRLFREERRDLRKVPFNWTLDENQRDLNMQRYLPGKKVSKFEEEQLFFMSYVRQACRGNWKTHKDYYELDRFFLETQILEILMQMEEFSKVWHCPKHSPMNNKGFDRCMRWIP